MRNKTLSRGLTALLVTILAVGLTAPTVTAQDGEFNFGSVQKTKGAAMEPGDSHTFTLLFFNEGDRVTHVRLQTHGLPDDWTVDVEPPLHDQLYDVSGVEKTVEENLYILPYDQYGEIHGITPPLENAPETAPDGVKYVNLEGVNGYIPAKEAKITVTVPEDTPLGTNQKFTVAATAFSLTRGGTVSVSQARDFDYTVSTRTNEFSEVPIQDASTDGAGNGNSIPEEIKYVLILVTGFVLAGGAIYLKNTL